MNLFTLSKIQVNRINPLPTMPLKREMDSMKNCELKHIITVHILFFNYSSILGFFLLVIMFLSLNMGVSMHITNHVIRANWREKKPLSWSYLTRPVNSK